MSGPHGDCPNTPEGPPDEITAAFEAIMMKKLDIQREITHLTRENEQYRVRFEFLSQKVSGLSTFLGQSASILSQLCDSSRNALQIARTSCDTPTVVKKRSVGAQNVPKKALVRHNFHIEPLDLTALQRENVATSSPISHENLREQEHSDDDEPLQKRLTTIYEESLRRQSAPKELYVQVSRLPNTVIENNSRERDLSISNNSLDISMDPTFCSTPLKLETMKKLGLVPCSEVQKLNNFVSVRQKANKPVKLSPTKEIVQNLDRTLRKRNTTSPKSPDLKKPKLSPKKSKGKEETKQVENSRPHRSAKPKNLKEDNLKSKKRRN
ncbi:hypothetical protein TcasGA2_TC031290 [Tribolium castaneum]|uniref:Uncharacterized protein n=1 Tax=Tribolium castaneum TaxID=7070 RepID=A0A139WCW3_TRICA|nr:PREDICTED: uncharacterized protein LOC660737 isoform X1 [Tribolium castaneum]XP_976356.2 PREDICTED: uncharacterized protein LOC660737 isoform X1 [Tribolium castaneum]KYB25773.1 hypothetical protein TcasGA2_TC031290 [Tribolium castaneum]|eukprot:XP_008197244.1 PREDICTED: uncharacterized protein LOC660737 isoform X1 [Tribolium castaneum]